MESAPDKIIVVQNQELRRRHILDNLLIGDIKKIAKKMGVTTVWVSYVLHGKGTSEPVLQAAESMLAERKQNIA